MDPVPDLTHIQNSRSTGISINNNNKYYYYYYYYYYFIYGQSINVFTSFCAQSFRFIFIFQSSLSTHSMLLISFPFIPIVTSCIHEFRSSLSLPSRRIPFVYFRPTVLFLQAFQHCILYDGQGAGLMHQSLTLGTRYFWSRFSSSNLCQTNVSCICILDRSPHWVLLAGPAQSSFFMRLLLLPLSLFQPGLGQASAENKT